MVQIMYMFIAEEDLWIEMSYAFNEVIAVFLLNNPEMSGNCMTIDICSSTSLASEVLNT